PSGLKNPRLPALLEEEDGAERPGLGHGEGGVAVPRRAVGPHPARAWTEHDTVVAQHGDRGRVPAKEPRQGGLAGAGLATGARPARPGPLRAHEPPRSPPVRTGA